ncbi:putative PurR-regulated permease PerM [Actimicrobium sp. GrIS 1.19]|uniref:AI-2E family transporter n=1 Tax=Actimicrobium sp. GrIS 1.19 TaxID=3071708 RepID=UPI002DFA1B32|nr:putative PurR-regulated permease PerM [Actimicrobium sp. GrIS 1.19]
MDSFPPEPPVVTEKPERTQRIHVDVHGLPLAIVGTVALVFGLQTAQKFLIPLIFGIFLTYTLNPLVNWLERLRIGRFAATCVVMLALLGAIGGGTSTLADEFQSIMQSLPEASHKISRALLLVQTGGPSAMQRMQSAANEIASATTGSRTVQRAVVSEAPGFRVNELLLAGSMGAAGLLGQAMVVLFLVFFLLLSGDTFKRKLVKLTGPTLSKKKITVQILDAINKSIQNYMSMLLLTNVLLTVLMWVTFRVIGLENAGAWAVAAGLLHIIPYFGPLLIAFATGVSALMQFGTVSMALVVMGAGLGVAALVGTFVTTWMTGRIARMNAAAVFISLLFWGWLWGVWGLLLGVPIVVIVRVVAEHIEEMQSIAELLGE